VSLILPMQRGAARFEFEIDLEGESFFFRFEWNDRAGSWFFDVLTVDQEPLVSGVKVVLGIPLLNRYRDPRLPLGMLEAIDTSDSGAEAAFADLGDRVLLLYTLSSEIPPGLALPE